VSRIPLNERRNQRQFIPWLALVLLALAACKGGEAAPETNSTQAELSSDFLGETSAASSFYGGDTSKLHFGAPAERVLVLSKDEPWIRAGEFDAWLGTYPLDITASDPEEAQLQALEQMVTFKLIVAKAREAGYAQRLDGGGGTLESKALAISYIRDRMTDIGGVSDAEAREFLEAHRELFAGIDDPRIPPELRAAAVKGSVRGQQLRAQIAEWRAQAGIHYGEGVAR
jgi:hypothetical protein